MKLQTILTIAVMYVCMIFVLDLISNSSVVVKLFFGFALLNIIFVLITLYVKYVVDLIKKIKNKN